MRKGKYLIIFGLIGLFFLILPLPSSTAELDKTRKMKAEAEYYFDKGEYYKAIDIWAEVIKINSYDKEALLGISKAQEIIEKSKGEKEKDERQRLQELIQGGKNYCRDRDYKKALSSWGEALSIDPTNKEVLDLIEETRIKAQYQISILDKLDREKRLKTPHVADLDKIADRMINLLEKADVKIRKKKAKEIKKEAKEEAVTKVDEEKEFIETTFAKGEEFYKEGRFKEAISEWNKILAFLPKSSEIAVKIEELKERIAVEEKKKAEEELRQTEEIERRRKEEKKRKRFEEERKEKARLPGEAQKREEIFKAQREIEEKPEKPKVREEGFPGKPFFAKASPFAKASGDRLEGKRDLLVIGIILLLVLLFIVKITTRTKVKPHVGKAPPKKLKKEEDFEPRDLKKFLKKKPDEDKDLFK